MQIGNLFVICLIFSGTLIYFYITKFHVINANTYKISGINNADVNLLSDNNLTYEMEGTAFTIYDEIRKNAQEEANVGDALNRANRQITGDYTNEIDTIKERTHDDDNIAHDDTQIANDNTIKEPRESDTTRYRLMLDDFRGRLGNHMFQYTAGFGVAHRHNLTFIIPDSLDLITIFDIKAEVFNDIPGSNLHFRKYSGGDDFYRQTVFNSDAEIKTYGQSYKYFETCPLQIRKEFTFRNHIKREVNVLFDRISLGLPSNTTFVGVHARRGEKANKTRSLKEGWVVPDENYFKKAMDYFRNKYGNVAFIICSDTPSWTKEIFRSQADAYFCPGRSPASDLAILSNCDHTIMSVGTFGFWAGWLVNGTTIYYAHPKKDIYITSNFFNETKSPIRHFYPKEWLPMG
ncbi:unnamed protein product [Owenia fusiformis]|uniref:L-Fucosyltransferase n=1 Tax=Owenia fusiformis TaxID=6347 RepID=A0A8J1TX60_OWEFU|nr:unnamed protein product [Owenia fusiformis]